MVSTKMKWTIGIFAVLVVGVGLGVGLGLGLKKRSSVAEGFSSDFNFGAASAAYQIEGYSTADGKGPSIWDDFTKQEGRIVDGSSTDDGPDSYKFYKEDVALLKNLGMQFYRFSISWSRVMSDGTKATVNEPGLQYYDNLINELLANNIQPVVTMFHWDLPSRLQDLGGPMNPMFPRYFEDYATLLFERYGDRVKEWLTFNEPIEYCANGYAINHWAPGIAVAGGEYYCVHHIILAHARTYHLYNKSYRESQKGRIGISLNTGMGYPKDPNNPSDVAAAERSLMFQFGIFAHPFFLGHYPEVVKTSVDQYSTEQGFSWSRLPEIDEEMSSYIKGTVDYLGINYYSSCLATSKAATPGEAPMIHSDKRLDCIADSSWPQATSTWLYSYPDGLRDLLLFIKDTYNGIETIITENGWSDAGELEDDNRVEYLRLHLLAVLEAIDGGANVTGYTTWSLVDNFEWLMGYTEHFGLHGFDKVTKERLPKKSVEFFKKVIAERVLPEKVPTPIFP